MNKKVLTISIASYNIEKFVDETLSSFIIPEIMDDLEVIAVNDGSKDRTSLLAKKYVDMYPDTFVVIDKENGGYGSTINASSRIARGKYFKTLDGDDWVDKAALTDLVKYLKNTDDDIVVTNYCRVNDKTKRKYPTKFMCKELETSMAFEDGYIDQQLFMQAISIKTSILKSIDINITEHCFYTDIEYILTPVPYINTISYLDRYVYMYRVAVNEQSMSVAGKRKHIDEQLKIFTKMLNYYLEKKDGLSVAKQNYFKVILSEMYKSHITAILSLDISESAKNRLLDLEKYLKNNAMDIYLSTDKYKTIRILRKTNYSFYIPGSIAYKLYQKILQLMGR